MKLISLFSTCSSEQGSAACFLFIRESRGAAFSLAYMSAKSARTRMRHSRLSGIGNAGSSSGPC